MNNILTLIMIALLLVWGGTFIMLNWEQVKVKAYKAMLIAKSMAKEGILDGGEAQENWVVDNLWILLPIRLRLCIGSKERLRVLIKWLYHKTKDKLDDGKFNNSI